MSEWIEMGCKKMGYCSQTALPVLILESRDQCHFLPVFVTYPEWTLLSCPGYPDLTMEAALWPVVDGLLEALESKVTEVRVRREGTTFFGNLVIDGFLGERVLETRAGEAIAVALRTSAPIYVWREQAVERSNAALTSCSAADEQCVGGGEACITSTRSFTLSEAGLAN
jgi:hypothetical protein